MFNFTFQDLFNNLDLFYSLFYFNLKLIIFRHKFWESFVKYVNSQKLHFWEILIHEIWPGSNRIRLSNKFKVKLALLLVSKAWVVYCLKNLSYQLIYNSDAKYLAMSENLDSPSQREIDLHTKRYDQLQLDTLSLDWRIHFGYSFDPQPLLRGQIGEYDCYSLTHLKWNHLYVYFSVLLPKHLFNFFSNPLPRNLINTLALNDFSYCYWMLFYVSLCSFFGQCSEGLSQKKEFILIAFLSPKDRFSCWANCDQDI